MFPHQTKKVLVEIFQAKRIEETLMVSIVEESSYWRKLIMEYLSKSKLLKDDKQSES